MTSQGDDGRDQAGIGVAVAGGGIVGVVALAVLVVVVVGLGGVRAGRITDESDAATAPVADEAVEPRSIEGPTATYDAVVAVAAAGSSLRPSPVIDQVDPGDVVEVRASGFLASADGVVAQCDELQATTCANVVHVRTDEHGRARTPYRLGEPAQGDWLVVEVDLERAGAGLVFGEAAPIRPKVTVDATGTLSIEGARPGTQLSVARCPVGATEAAECDRAARVRTSVAGTARTASIPGPGDDLVVLLDGKGSVVAEPVRLPGRPGPEVDLDPSRLIGGLVLAAVLAGLAVVLVRSTDWRVSAEAATPLLDAATFDA